MESRIGTVSSGVGYPAVTKVTSAEVFYRRHRSREKIDEVMDCRYLCRFLLEYILNVLHCGTTTIFNKLVLFIPGANELIIFLPLSGRSRTGKLTD